MSPQVTNILKGKFTVLSRNYILVHLKRVKSLWVRSQVTDMILGSSLDALGRTGSARLIWRIVDRRQGGASRGRCWEAAAAAASAHRHPLQVPQPVARLQPLDHLLCCRRPRPRRHWRPRASCPPCHSTAPSAYKPAPLRDRFLRHRDSKREVA